MRERLRLGKEEEENRARKEGGGEIKFVLSDPNQATHNLLFRIEERIQSS